MKSISESMTNKQAQRIFAMLLMMLFYSVGAYAADELGSGMCNVVNVLTGKWLFAFTVLATLGGGAVILFGGEISDGIKKIATIVSIVGLIVAVPSLMAIAYSKFSGMTC